MFRDLRFRVWGLKAKLRVWGFRLRAWGLGLGRGSCGVRRTSLAVFLGLKYRAFSSFR